jgi:hypothetical protein
MKDVLGVYERKERFLEKWVEYEGRQKSSSLALHTIGYESLRKDFHLHPLAGAICGWIR